MEDKEGIRDVGKPGRYLKKILENLEVDLENDCRKITAVNCKTDSGKKPTDLEIDCCRPMVYKEIDEFQPKLIILLGTSAIKSFYGEKWKKSIGGIEKWRGWQIPDRECKAWVCPTFHPSFVQKEKNPAAEVIFKRDLRKAFRLLRKDLPQYLFDPPDNLHRAERLGDELICTQAQPLLPVCLLSLGGQHDDIDIA